LHHGTKLILSIRIKSAYMIFTKTEIILVNKFNKLYPTLIIID